MSTTVFVFQVGLVVVGILLTLRWIWRQWCEWRASAWIRSVHQQPWMRDCKTRVPL